MTDARLNKIKQIIHREFVNAFEIPDGTEAHDIEEWVNVVADLIQLYPETNNSQIKKAFLAELEHEMEYDEPDRELFKDTLAEIPDKVNLELNIFESGLLQEIHETAPAVIYKPGSIWLPKPQGKWSPDQKAINREISDLHRRNERVVLPKKKQIPEWKIICSQLGEFRKDELIYMAWQLDIGTFISPKWTKAKICEIMSKHMSVL